MPDNAQVQSGGFFSRLASLPNESVAKMVLVTTILCLVCSILVSSAAVFLKPRQDRNVELARKERILEVAGLMEPDRSIDELFQSVEVRVVDLETGEYTDAVDPDTYDQRVAARDPKLSEAVPPWEDIAGIKRRARYAPVYLVKKDGELEKIVGG